MRKNNVQQVASWQSNSRVTIFRYRKKFALAHMNCFGHIFCILWITCSLKKNVIYLGFILKKYFPKSSKWPISDSTFWPRQGFPPFWAVWFSYLVLVLTSLVHAWEQQFHSDHSVHLQSTIQKNWKVTPLKRTKRYPKTESPKRRNSLKGNS